MQYEMPELILEASTLYSEARLANVRPLLESVLELTILVTGGPNSCEWFAKLDPDGSWLKIAQDSCQLTMDGSLETYCGSWPKRGILRDGSAGELPTWAHRIDGSGCLLWGTPNAADAVGSHGGGQGKSLRTDIWEETHWPTPIAGDYRSPSKPDSKRIQRKTEQGWTQDLRDVVTWATPLTSDNKPACMREIVESKAPKQSTTMRRLRGQATEKHQLGMALNPDWVEALQGYPPGWTKLPED